MPKLLKTSSANASLTDYLKSSALYLLPHHFISRIIYKLTRLPSRFVPAVIRRFSQVFKVNLAEAVHTDPSDYGTFNEFFTREIKTDLRPMAEGNDILVSPVDGTISQLGRINDDCLLQAKGHQYTASELLGGDAERAKIFHQGVFATLYLSPRDYHRIHMPCDGKLIEQVYIPGRLFSVAPHTVKTIDRVFARNERVVAIFNTKQGKLAMILVGAINVAAIETVWDGLITPSESPSLLKTLWRKKQISQKFYRDNKISLKKGQEMGRFNMGSTVILLHENPTYEWLETLRANTGLKMGQKIANLS